MPIMFNLHENGSLGDAAALYTKDDFYVPRKFVTRYPDAVAFVLIKTESKPTKLHRVYYNARHNLYLLDSKVDAHQNLVGLTYGPDMQRVLDYLTGRGTEPDYLGSWVTASLNARLPRIRQGWRGGD